MRMNRFLSPMFMCLLLSAAEVVEANEGPPPCPKAGRDACRVQAILVTAESLVFHKGSNATPVSLTQIQQKPTLPLFSGYQKTSPQPAATLHLSTKVAFSPTLAREWDALNRICLKAGQADAPLSKTNDKLDEFKAALAKGDYHSSRALLETAQGLAAQVKAEANGAQELANKEDLSGASTIKQLADTCVRNAKENADLASRTIDEAKGMVADARDKERDEAKAAATNADLAAARATEAHRAEDCIG